MRNGPVIQTSFGPMQWSAPIDYANVVFDGAGLFPGSIKHYDVSARKNHGTLTNGPAWRYAPEIGRWGVSLASTSSQYVPLWTGWILNMIGGRGFPITFCAWVRTLSTERQVIVGDWDSSGANEAFFVELTLAGGLRATYGNDAGAAIGGAYSLNTWHHVAFAHLGTTANPAGRLYVDGVQVATRSGMGITRPVSDQVATIGRAGVFGALYFNGTISNPMFFRAALSPSQILWLANRNNLPWQPYKTKRYWLASAAPATTLDGVASQSSAEATAGTTAAGLAVAGTVSQSSAEATAGALTIGLIVGGVSSQSASEATAGLITAGEMVSQAITGVAGQASAEATAGAATIGLAFTGASSQSLAEATAGTIYIGIEARAPPSQSSVEAVVGSLTIGLALSGSSAQSQTIATSGRVLLLTITKTKLVKATAKYQTVSKTTKYLATNVTAKYGLERI